VFPVRFRSFRGARAGRQSADETGRSGPARSPSQHHARGDGGIVRRLASSFGSAGDFLPTLAAAAALRRRGHDVRFVNESGL